MIITSESHLDHGLTPAQVEFIKRLFRDRQEFFKETITLPVSLGTVETALVGPASGADAVPESDVRYVTRSGRKWASRVLTVPQPRPRVRTVTVIAGPDGGEPCVLYTAYGGPLAPREPGDPDIATQEELDESRAFWSEHALIVDDVRSNPMSTRQDMTVEEFDAALVAGKYTSVGSYPLYFVTSDGQTLSFETAREEAEQIREAIRDHDNSGWRVIAADVNWEDPELYDSHSGERIESAYAEDDAPKPVERNEGEQPVMRIGRRPQARPRTPEEEAAAADEYDQWRERHMAALAERGRARGGASVERNSTGSEWRKRQIILPTELVTELSQWHASQDDPLYALSSTGAADLVSLSMIDAALASLEDAKREAELTAGEMGGPFVKQIDDVQSELSTVRQFWKEHSAQESGMDTDADDFTWEYDKRDYGLPPEDEAAIETGSG